MTKSKRKPFVTSANFEFSEACNFEHPVGASETKPDEVLTPRQMLENFTRGLPLANSARQPIYSDEELPDFERMDIDEIHAYQEELREEIESYQKELKDAEEAEAKRLLDIAIEEKAKQLLPKPKSGATDEGEAS